MPSPYRAPESAPENPKPVEWYVHICEDPWYVTGSRWAVYGPFQWRWLARLLVWTCEDYEQAFVSEHPWRAE